MKSGTCYLFAHRIKQSFEQTEVIRLAQHFQHVKVVIFSENQESIKVPQNVEFIKILPPPIKLRHVLFSVNTLLLLKIFFSDFISNIKNMAYLRKSKPRMALLASAIIQAETVKQHFRQHPIPKNAVFLSLWFSDLALILSILKQKKIILTFFSRAHGRDLFEYREPLTKKLPFRRFMLSNVKKVYSVSHSGQLYLQKKYPKFATKIHTQYLGTGDFGLNPQINEKQTLTIASCARVRNVKRIHLIAEAVLQPDIPIKWIHIGDENKQSKSDPTVVLYQEFAEKLAQKQNVEHIRAGHLSQREMFELYKSEPIDVFINVSESEGLPVSIMEAASFGIPIIATDVGGTNEIVNEQTGILLDKDFKTEELAGIIDNFKDSKYNTPEFRQGVRQFWKNNFSAEKNYTMLCEILING